MMTYKTPPQNTLRLKNVTRFSKSIENIELRVYAILRPKDLRSAVTRGLEHIELRHRF